MMSRNIEDVSGVSEMDNFEVGLEVICKIGTATAEPHSRNKVKCAEPRSPSMATHNDDVKPFHT